MRKLYDLPPPGERELYVSVFDRPVALRPGVELRGYATRTLWDEFRRLRSGEGAGEMNEEPRDVARVGLGQAPPGPRRARFSHAAMATVFEVHCVHPDARYAAQAAQAAFDRVDRLEQELSRFIENSDVSRINALREGEATQVSPSTMECLEIAWHMRDVTGGAFDVSIGSGLGGLELEPEAFTVRARAGGVRLDLGGVGKGYAVDRMAAVLLEWEIPRSLVHGGFSSVLALEAPPDREGWPLTLSAPGSPGVRSWRGSRRGGRPSAPRGCASATTSWTRAPGSPVRGRAAAWVADPAGRRGLAGRAWPTPSRPRS